MRGSGDGFVTLQDGSRRWGRYGAAGVLLRCATGDGDTSYFVALRSPHCHHGGTWSIPGGAIDRGESPLDGALREFREEIDHVLDDVVVAEVHEDDHGGWSYWTIVVDVAEPFEAPAPCSWETSECRWVRADELVALELFGAFRATLHRLGIIDPQR